MQNRYTFLTHLLRMVNSQNIKKKINYYFPEIKKIVIQNIVFSALLSIIFFLESIFVQKNNIQYITIICNVIVVISFLNTIFVLRKNINKNLKLAISSIVIFLFSIGYLINLLSIKNTGTILSIKDFDMFFLEIIRKINWLLFVSVLTLILLIIIYFLKHFERFLFLQSNYRIRLFLVFILFSFSFYLIFVKGVEENHKIALLSNFRKKDGVEFEDFLYKVQSKAESKNSLENSIYPYISHSKFNKDVYLILVDDLRKDHMSLYGYNRKTTPFLDSLFKEKKIFIKNDVYSNSSETVYSLLNLFHSRQAGKINLNDLKLNDCIKKGLNYSTWNFTTGETGGDYGWKGSKKIIANWDYSLEREESELNVCDDSITLKKIKDFSESKINNKFVFIHFMACHLYWGFQNSKYIKYLPNDWSKLSNFQIESNIKGGINEYDNRIIQQDDELRQFYNNLKINDQLKNSIIIILSDHGESFLEPRPFGKLIAHGSYLYNESIDIPFIYSGFELPEGKCHATTIDIAPTIIELIGLKIPSYWEGHSLFHPLISNFSYHNSNSQNGVIFSNKFTKLKYLVDKYINRAYLFNLSNDKKDAINIINSGKFKNELIVIKKYYNEKSR